MDFIETVLIKNSEIQNLKYHQNRINKTAKHFKWKKIPELKNIDLKKDARVRITYSSSGIKNIEYFPLIKRNFKKFKLINISFEYAFKYKNRKIFENIKKSFTGFDEFILIKNNLITDTTISNLAFFDGKEWYTPKHPLFYGTKREELLDKGFLKEENIHKYDLPYFKKIAMLNAILGFYEIKDFDIII